jgi:ketosteroid isomerase-like protein
MIDLADRFVAAIEHGDLDAIRAAYAPDARIWHNTDPPGGDGQSVEDNLRVLGWMRRVLKNIRYEIVRREALPDGFLQQHVLHGTIVTDGAPFAMPAVIVCRVKDGRIARLEEYLDSAQAAPLAAAAETLRKARM